MLGMPFETGRAGVDRLNPTARLQRQPPRNEDDDLNSNASILPQGLITFGNRYVRLRPLEYPNTGASREQHRQSWGQQQSRTLSYTFGVGESWGGGEMDDPWPISSPNSFLNVCPQVIRTIPFCRDAVCCLPCVACRRHPCRMYVHACRCDALCSCG